MDKQSNLMDLEDDYEEEFNKKKSKKMSKVFKIRIKNYCKINKINCDL